MNLLSIIIVSYNTRELLKKCLESIRKLEVGSWKLETIVVDNGSTDGSVEMINEEWLMVKRKKSSTINHKQSLLLRNQPLVIKLIANQTNLGFAKANNMGIKISSGEYIMLLNSDTEIKSGVIEKLIDFSKTHKDAGLVGARLLNLDRSIQPSVYYFPNFRRVFGEIFLKSHSYFEKYFVQGSQPTEVEAIVFAAVLIPKKTIEKVGLLDERYFMYFEDLDYCRRVHKEKLKVYYLPTAEVIHYHGASGKGGDKIFDYSTESSKIYYGKIKFWLLKIILRGIHKWQKIFGKK